MTIRPIDANVAMNKIREYMEDFPNATARLAACRAILSMLGDENQMPTLTPPNVVLTCDGCMYAPDLPFEIHCRGCARLYTDHYRRPPEGEDA